MASFRKCSEVWLAMELMSAKAKEQEKKKHKLINSPLKELKDTFPMLDH
jgi:hypothetical protein